MCPFHRKWTNWVGSWTMSRGIPLNDHTITRTHTQTQPKIPTGLGWFKISMVRPEHPSWSSDPNTQLSDRRDLKRSPQTSHVVYVQNRHWWPITASNGDNEGKRRLCECSKMNSKETRHQAFISRRPKETLKITAVETARKLPTWSGRRKQAIKCRQGSQLWL